jgi:predicted RNA binding protein with dsRBD fold (UPF0201 family)
MKYEIEMTEQDIKDLRAVRNYFGENDRTIFEHKAYAILDGIVKKLNTPRVSKCDEPVRETTVCDTCRYSKSMKHHDYMWCRDCQQGSHYEQTVC